MARQRKCPECGGAEEGRRRCLTCLGLGVVEKDEKPREKKAETGASALVARVLTLMLAATAAAAGAVHGKTVDPLNDPTMSGIVMAFLWATGAMALVSLVRNLAAAVVFVAALVTLDGVFNGFRGAETVIDRAPLLLYAVERFLGL